MHNLQGQILLETSLAIIIVVLLLAGILNIWLWGNKQIVERQGRYNATRVVAGTSTDSYMLQWPVYKPGELTEDMVLKGR